MHLYSSCAEIKRKRASIGSLIIRPPKNIRILQLAKIIIMILNKNAHPVMVAHKNNMFIIKKCIIFNSCK